MRTSRGRDICFDRDVVEPNPARRAAADAQLQPCKGAAARRWHRRLEQRPLTRQLHRREHLASDMPHAPRLDGRRRASPPTEHNLDRESVAPVAIVTAIAVFIAIVIAIAIVMSIWSIFGF